MTDTDDQPAAPHRDTAAAPENAAPRAGGFFSSPAAKFFAIAFLTGLLVMPLLLVWALTAEREYRRNEVLAKIDRDWGGSQTVQGPFLLVPYTVTKTSFDQTSRGQVGEPVSTYERRTAVFLPDSFDATTVVDTDVRSVAIFNATVYTATITAKGAFPALDESKFETGTSAIHWDRARVALRLSDVAGIEELRMTNTTGGGALSFEPGLMIEGERSSGVYAPIPATMPGVLSRGFGFEMNLRLRGNRQLTIVPVGSDSTVAMTADWPHPDFTGRTLPSERTVTDAGFEAKWRVPYLARSTPQAFTIVRGQYSEFFHDPVGVGATFGEPVDFYALVERALKYGIMFVAAVFGLVFFLEILSPRRIHVVQYALVGLIVVFFYVLLLALSEQIGFGWAYLSASTATGTVITAFVGLALASRIRAIVAALGFTGLFALLYAILTLEDIALLAGALTGFVALTFVLFATRKVDWSGSRAGPVEARTAGA